jgi:transposase-like protein
MAALSGVMTADFSQFTQEVDRSVVKLRELEGAGMSTGNAFGDMAEGLGAADRVLSTVGVNLSRPIGALRELGNVAGLTFEKLGTFGSLGLAASVGVATYELTKMGAEFIGLDTAIGNATAKLLGWGDVAAANATAQADALALATQRAGYAVTTVTEAIRVNTEWNAKNAAALNTGAQRLADWDRQISKVRNSGDLETITRELKEGSSTVKQLAERFGISAEAITHYTNRAKESATILDKLREKERADLKKVSDAQAELNQLGGGWRDTLLTIAPATAAAATAALALGGAQSTIATAMSLSEVQVSALNKALQEQTRILQLNEPAIGSLDSWMKSLAPEIRKAGESQMFFDQQLMASIATVESAAVPALEKLEETYRSVTEAARETAVETSKNAPGAVGVNLGNVAFGPGGLEAAFKAYSLRYSQSGVGAIGGGPAEDFLSWAMRAGYTAQGTTVNNTFNVVDTESAIARRVSEEISRQIQRGSLVQ